MAEAGEREAPALRGLQKAAVALISLGSAASASILKHMPEEDVERLTNAIARTGPIDPVQVDMVLNEAAAALGRKKYLVGGLEYARNMLETAFGREIASRQIERLAKSLAGEEATFEHLSKIDAQQLAKFIQDEHPQAVAVILSRLLPSQSANVLLHLPKETHANILRRMAALDQISPELVRLVSNVIRQKLQAFGELREACGGVKAVADLCNRMDPSVCNAALETLEADDPSLVESVRRLMFVFEDLQNIDPNALRDLIAKVDRKVLMVALKGTNADLKKHICGQMSERASAMMQEDIEALGPVRLRDVDDAQQQIIAIARSSGLAANSNGTSDVYIS